MTSTYDSTGITLDRYADILDRLVTLSETQWGDGINTDEDSYLGHTLRVIATIIGETNEILQSVYDSMSVSNATGTNLDNRLELIGLSRSAAAYSTVTLTLTATDATTVPAGSQYATSADIIFATDSALVFTGAGSDDVEATCIITGANEAAASTVTTIKTPIYGISACTNAAAATPGRSRQSSASLKEAHTIAVSTSGERDAASIYEAILAVTGVSSVYILDNNTSSTIGSVPANTLAISVIGGDTDDIAEAIDNTITATVATYGTTTVSVYGATTSQDKDINFTVAANTDIYVDIDYTPVEGVFPEDGEAQLKTELLAHFDDLDIADTVVYNTLYKPIYTVPGVTLNTLYTGTAASPSGTSDITRTSAQRATLTAANITITVS